MDLVCYVLFMYEWTTPGQTPVYISIPLGKSTCLWSSKLAKREQVVSPKGLGSWNTSACPTDFCRTMSPLHCLSLKMTTEPLVTSQCICSSCLSSQLTRHLALGVPKNFVHIDVFSCWKNEDETVIIIIFSNYQQMINNLTFLWKAL